MDVSVNPSLSSASLMAPTRPSIISDGPTYTQYIKYICYILVWIDVYIYSVSGPNTSDPALACIIACFWSCIMVISFTIFPSFTTPSWPWSEYGSSAMSVHTIVSGNFDLMRDRARGTIPLGLYASYWLYVDCIDCLLIVLIVCWLYVVCIDCMLIGEKIYSMLYHDMGFHWLY